MNESELKQYCLEHAGETLPAEAEAFLKSNPEIKRQVDQLVFVSKLISLKKYEQPHATCALRCINAVNARIEEDRNASAWTRLGNWFADQHAAAQLSYGLAAMIICMVGLNFFMGSDQGGAEIATAPDVPTIESDAAPKVVETLAEVITPASEKIEEVAINTKEFPAFEKPLIVLQVSSNPQPSSGISFGGGASVPVSFEY